MQRIFPILAVAAVLAGCSSVEYRRGLPIIAAKPPDVLLVRGVEGLPDLRRGNQALRALRFDDAEHDFASLAKRGYPDAQLDLAALYVQHDTLVAEGEAIQWYRTALPQRPEADLALARMLVYGGSRSSAIEALELIHHAQAERGDPFARSVLLTLYTAYPDLDPDEQAPALADSAAQSDLPADRIAAIDWYRRNIAANDHAQRLQALCRANLAIALRCYVDLAHFVRYQGDRAELHALVTQALATFEKGVLPPDPADPNGRPVLFPPLAARLATAMVDQPEVEDVTAVYLDFKSDAEAAAAVDAEAKEGAGLPIIESADTKLEPLGRPVASSSAAADEADRILRWMLKQAGEFPAQAASVAAYYVYLLPDIDLVPILEEAAARDQHAAKLTLGELYQHGGGRTPVNPDGALKYLLASLDYRSTTQSAHYHLGRLYQSGFLGAPAHQEAVDHLLTAARLGNIRAYIDLAKLFYVTPGFRINRVYAYVFARCADDAGWPVVLHLHVFSGDAAANGANPAPGAPLAARVAYNLVDRLRSEMTTTELDKAEQLYRAERKLHTVVHRPLPADIYSRKAP